MLLRGYKIVKLSLTGGEVSILPDLSDILRTLAGSVFRGGIYFDITTNFSAQEEEYAKLCSIVDENSGRFGHRGLHITASFYRDRVTAEDFLQKLTKLVSLVSKEAVRFSGRWFVQRLLGENRHADFSLTVAYPIVTDKDYEEYQVMKKQLSDTPIVVSPLLIREYKTSISAGIKNSIIKSGANGLYVTDGTGKVTRFRSIQYLGAVVSEKGVFCPLGYICDAGIHNLWINALGEVYRCPAIGSDMSLGSMIDGSFKLLTEPAVCTSRHCSCSQFGMIRKV